MPPSAACNSAEVAINFETVDSLLLRMMKNRRLAFGNATAVTVVAVVVAVAAFVIIFGGFVLVEYC